MKLSDVKTGETCRIKKVKGIGAFRKRIMEMGFLEGKLVKVIKNAPLADPIQYQILGYDVTLRRADAELIRVTDKIDTNEEIEGRLKHLLLNDIKAFEAISGIRYF